MASILQTFEALAGIVTSTDVVGIFPSAQLRQLNQSLSFAPVHKPAIPLGQTTVALPVNAEAAHEPFVKLLIV